MRIALGIEYNGANFSGWQRQKHKPSIQAHIESALSKVANEPIQIYCAGRTDAGVHASGQVIHFDTQADRAEMAWIRGVNAYLPPEIRIIWQKAVSSDFNARKSAISRRYMYVVANRSIQAGILHNRVTSIFTPLNEEWMQAGANYLLGQHDFTSFRGSQCQARTPVRTLHNFTIRRRDHHIFFDVKGNAFLHHMVRNMVGTLLSVGQGKFPPAWVETVLHSKDRRAAGITASPQGLYLIEVSYPNKYGLPLSPLPFYLW